MSGIEIAGLILGLFPVVVEVLKSFTSRSMAADIIEMRRMIECEEAIYKNTLEQLLSPHVTELQLIGLLNNPMCSFWGDADLNEALEIQLGKVSFKIFGECIEDISKWLQQIRKDIVEQVRYVLEAVHTRLVLSSLPFLPLKTRILILTRHDTGLVIKW